MVRFNIDTRSVVESGWIYNERLSDSGIIFKSIDTIEAGEAEYRKTMLRVSCLGNDQLMVGYAREVGPKEKSFVPLKFVAAQQEFKLAPPAEPVSSNSASKRYDIRRAPVPMLQRIGPPATSPKSSPMPPKSANSSVDTPTPVDRYS